MARVVSVSTRERLLRERPVASEDWARLAVRDAMDGNSMSLARERRLRKYLGWPENVSSRGGGKHVYVRADNRKWLEENDVDVNSLIEQARSVCE